MEKKLHQKIEKGFSPLENKSVVVAFSGGVDSTVVARLIREITILGKIKLVTVVTEWISSFERKEADSIAKELGIEHDFLEIPSNSTHKFWMNTPNRCFYCKMTIFSHLWNYTKKMNYDIVVDGTNASDINGHRPGLKALKKLGVYSPLLESGLFKDEIRQIAAYYNLSVTEKPAMACLASRIPYGEPISPERLKRIELGENVLHELSISSQFRLRDHGEIARIEIDPKDFTNIFERNVKDLIKRLKKIGYNYITLDLEGYRPAVPKK